VLLTTNLAEAGEGHRRNHGWQSVWRCGHEIVIQEFLEGAEISLHALCDGKTASCSRRSQDHKRALDGDQGLNTGGMGAYSPVPFLNDAQLAAVGKQILGPWLKGCARRELIFAGIIYPVLMLDQRWPRKSLSSTTALAIRKPVYLTR